MARDPRGICLPTLDAFRTLAAKSSCRSNPGNSCRRCHSLHSNYMLNRGYAYTTIISRKYHGQTLLSHLASLYPHSTPQAWQQKLNNGEVTLNGITATGSESVTLGQTLVWNRPPWIEPDSPQHFEVLFEDSHPARESPFQDTLSQKATRNNNLSVSLRLLIGALVQKKCNRQAASPSGTAQPAALITTIHQRGFGNRNGHHCDLVSKHLSNSFWSITFSNEAHTNSKRASTKNTATTRLARLKQG
jgi:hypothetical protein